MKLGLAKPLVLVGALQFSIFAGASPVDNRPHQIKRAIEWSLKGYEKFAWGKDKLIFPESGGTDGMHMAATLIDSIDTMHIAGLNTSKYEAFVERMDFSRIRASVNVFEATIRILGGLLSAHALTARPIYKQKAVEIGDILLAAYTPGRLQCSRITPFTKTCNSGRDGSLAEKGSSSIEFAELSRITGDPKYKEAVDNVDALLMKSACARPNRVSDTGASIGGSISIGGESDSFYEYLLKSAIQTGDERKLAYFEKCVDGLYALLYRRFPGGTTFGPHRNGRTSASIGHLDCFFPGLLALSSTVYKNSRHLEMAEAMMDTCVKLYKTPTGVGAESAGLEPHFRITNSENKLRPEVVESLFYLWRITGKERYRNFAWEMFRAFEKHARQPQGGYCAMRAGRACPRGSAGEYRDVGSMPSFWVGETLKYFYLIFTDSMPLKHWVFTTEAHPMPKI